MQQRVRCDDSGASVPRTLDTALRRLPEANLVCISVPGRYARREALRALEQGLHVFLFSDHVDLETEAELKQLAAQKGLLVMGPDCGTAILSGAPLAFANQLPRGPVGLVAASGSGLQQVGCLLAHQGIGVSQAVGVGGRDLHPQIGGRSMRAALQAFSGDADTQFIVLISKPPHPAVADILEREAKATGKPCVLAFLGDDSPSHADPGPYKVATLEAAASTTARLVRGKTIPPVEQSLPTHLVSAADTARRALQPTQNLIRGLYCGGSLAAETLWLLRHGAVRVDSNLDGTFSVENRLHHAVLDLGAEEFTSGRPHPMIDPTVRRQQLLRIAAQPEVAVILCDVMLGWGAHEAPGVALAEAWQEVQKQVSEQGRCLIGIAAVCGSPDDPQGYVRQSQVLEEQGFLLADSNAQAVRLAAAVAGMHLPSVETRTLPGNPAPTFPATQLATATPEVPWRLPTLFNEGPRVINLGLEHFADQLRACGVAVVHVNWQPPAGGNTRLAGLLERLR
jgi:FdrA protein